MYSKSRMHTLREGKAYALCLGARSLGAVRRRGVAPLLYHFAL